MVQPATEITMISVANLLKALFNLQEASKGPPEVQPYIMYWVRQHSLLTRTLIYGAVGTLAFVLAVGMGAIGALTFRDEPTLSERGDPQAFGGQGTGSRSEEEEDGAGNQQERTTLRQHATQEMKSTAGQGTVASQQDEAEYVGTVGDIQTRAVDTFLKSHDKLLQYDALAADDVEEMKANEATLQELADRATNLAPPRNYEGQHEVFSAAIGELSEAARLAHAMAADPVAAAELGFDEYDGHVNEASALLQRSNELLGKDYEAIEGTPEISPEF